MLTFNKKAKGSTQKESPHQKQGCWGEVPWGEESQLTQCEGLSCCESPGKVPPTPWHSAIVVCGSAAGQKEEVVPDHSVVVVEVSIGLASASASPAS